MSLTENSLLSSGLVIFPFVTSLPVRMIESSARLIVAQPMFSIVNVLSQSQPFGGFLVFLLASAGPKLSAVALFSSVTRADAGLLTVIVKAQLPVWPFSLLAPQLTVVTPAGKVE